LQKEKQRIHVFRTLRQGRFYGGTQIVPLGRRPLIAEPFLVMLSFSPGMLHDGIPIFDADKIVQASQGFGRSPKIPKLSLVIQRDGADDDMVVNVVLVNLLSLFQQTIYSMVSVQPTKITKAHQKPTMT
jgi:hypothetical protein